MVGIVPAHPAEGCLGVGVKPLSKRQEPFFGADLHALRLEAEGSLQLELGILESAQRSVGGPQAGPHLGVVGIQLTGCEEPLDGQLMAPEIIVQGSETEVCLGVCGALIEDLHENQRGLMHAALAGHADGSAQPVLLGSGRIRDVVSAGAARGHLFRRLVAAVAHKNDGDDLDFPSVDVGSSVVHLPQQVSLDRQAFRLRLGLRLSPSGRPTVLTGHGKTPPACTRAPTRGRARALPRPPTSGSRERRTHAAPQPSRRVAKLSLHLSSR